MKIALIKIGGLVAQDSNVLAELLGEIKKLKDHTRFVLVHGGGKEVTAVSDVFQLKAEFRDGIRITSPEEMDVVDMVLGGKINIDLVRKANTLGLPSVGLGGQDGKIFLGKALELEDRPGNRTGKIAKTQTRLLDLLLEQGFFPIIHSTTMDENGGALNVNADEAALEVAAALHVDTLVYISDIPGVMKEKTVLPRLDENSIKGLIGEGTIAGGMIPKVNSSLEGLKKGIGTIVIGGYSQTGDLEALLGGHRGTTISLLPAH